MKRDHLYVSQRHPCVWLMSLCMAASFIASLVLCRDETLTKADIWFGMVFPGIAILMQILMVVFSSDEMLHRTAVPVWILGLSFAIRAGSPVVWAACLLVCVLYTLILDGRMKKIWLLPVYLLALGGCAYLRNIPALLLIAGFALLFPAMKLHNDGKWHPRWGDRIEGRYVRTAQVMEQITAYFMPNRTGANNLFSESVEITELERYIRRKRREGMPGFGITHAILAAYVRTVAKYPALNRFIAGQRIYSRGEDVVACMTVKKELTATAPDSLVKVHLHPGDTAADVYRKFNAKVEEAKNEMETTADSTVAAFMMIPRLVLKGGIWLLKSLDYFGLVPRFLLEISPFHGSVYFTNIGSLGIKPVFHHLYDFGTVPVFCAYGRKRRAEEIKEGQIVDRKYVDLSFNLDERICDGFYYASVIKYFLRLLAQPDQLDVAPETIEMDIP